MTTATSRNRALGLFAALSLFYFIGAVVPGRFTVTDEVFFKSAGRNWAMTGHFAAPELTGRLAEGPPLSEVYFAQPPVYTFLFGLYVKMLGFSPRLCIAYDAIIHLVLIWTGMFLARTVYGLDWTWSALGGALLTPLGTVGRPDELGIVLTMWAAIAFRSRLSDRLRVPLGGALMGVCACTSLGAFVFLGPIVVWELLSSCQGRKAKIVDLGLAMLTGSAVAVACIAPILYAHPTAYQQLVTHAGEQSAVLSAFTGKERNSSLGFVEIWMTMMRYGYSYAVLIIGLISFGVFSGWVDKFSAHPAYPRMLILFLSWAVLVVAIPGKYPYFWFQACWLLIVCVALASHISVSIPLPLGRALLAFGAFVWLVPSMQSVRWGLIMWTLPRDQSLTLNTERLQAEVPANVAVMTTDYWWDLADRDRVYDLTFSDPGIDAIGYVILSGNGSGRPGVPTDFKAKYKPGFRPIYNHLNSMPTTIAGHSISRSAYGFGAYILKKMPPAFATATK